MSLVSRYIRLAWSILAFHMQFLTSGQLEILQRDTETHTFLPRQQGLKITEQLSIEKFHLCIFNV